MPFRDPASDASIDPPVATAGPRPENRTIALLVLGVVAASITWNFVLPAFGVGWHGATYELWHGVANASAQTVGAVLLWRGARTTSGRRRIAWSTIAAGATIGAAGSWIWSAVLASTGRHPTESTIDTVYAAALLITTVGVAVLPPTTERSLRVRAVDAAILMFTALTLVWVAPLHQRSDGELVAGFPTVDVYEIVTVLTILIAVAAVARCRPDRRGEIGPMAGALAMAGVGSLLYAASPEGYPASSRLGDTVFMVGFVLAAVAGARMSGPDRVLRRRGSDQAHRWLALPEVATITTLVAMTLHERWEDDPVASFLIGGTAVALAIARLLQLGLEQRRLSRSLQESAEQLHREARTDALTGLGNRLGFEERLRTTVERQSRLPVDQREAVAVAFVDIDHFKRFNDALGHAVGDGLLIEVARRLAQRCGPHVYRIGGDEFVAVLLGTDTAEACAAVAGAVDAFAAPVAVGDHEMAVSVSAGLSVWDALDQAPPTAEELVRRADLALYRSKELGRATWTAFDPALAERARRQHDLRTGLQHAVDADALEVEFEPVVALRGHRLVGATARLCWPGAGGVLQADAISRIAVEGGLVAATIAATFERVCAALAATAEVRTDAVGTPLWLSVPVTREELMHPALIDVVARLAGNRAACAGRLGIDVTEATVVDPTAATVLVAVRRLGVRVTVEQFGTGPSSLLTLDDYPADAIRLDRTFVEGLGRRRDDTVVVTTVTSLAQELGLEVSADGITEEFQSTYLEGLGVSTGRGPAFGERLDLAALVDRAGRVCWDEDRAANVVGSAS